MEPHSLVGGTGESGSVRLGPGLRPLKPTPHGPPTGSGGREKWFVDGRKKWEPASILSSFSQRVPLHVPSPPSWWAGRYGPFNVRAAGQVTSEKYNFPPHNPTREGSPEGRTSSLWGSFPHFFPRNGAPAGQATVPCRSNGVGENPQRPRRRRTQRQSSAFTRPSSPTARHSHCSRTRRDSQSPSPSSTAHAGHG